MTAALAHALRVAAAMRTEPLRRKPVRKWPRPRWPHKERLHYYKVLLAMVEIVQYVVRRDLFPQLGRLVAAHNVSRPEDEPIRFDTTGGDIDELFAALRAEAERAVPERQIEMEAQKNALRTAKWNGDELQRQVQEVARISIADDVAGLAEHLEVYVAENVALVKSLAYGQLDDLKGIVLRGARQGLHHTAIAEQIQIRFEVPKNRALLIATDQIGKLNGELNQIRQQKLGVRRYRWSSSQDERVRKGHRDLNGTIQEWAKPPVEDPRTGARGHPGQPIRCRCEPIPIIDDVLVDAGLMAPEDVELDQPPRGAPSIRPPLMSRLPEPLPPKRAKRSKSFQLPPVPPSLPQDPPANMPRTLPPMPEPAALASLPPANEQQKPKRKKRKKKKAAKRKPTRRP